VNDPQDGRPSSAEQRFASPDRLRVIPQAQTRTYDLPEPVKKMVDECNDQLYLVGIEFTDASGQRWYRDERAALWPRGGRAEWLLPELEREANEALNP